jgi:nucleotidyltransferase/DNA polymerase involved in DNA repair
MSALLLLLMTRPACLEVAKSERSRQALKELRNRTLDSLANHLKASGKNVDERMGQIIFLISDFQNLGRLIKHSIRLLMTATNYRAAPKEFLAFFEQQLDIYNKYAVF